MSGDFSFDYCQSVLYQEHDSSQAEHSPPAILQSVLQRVTSEPPQAPKSPKKNPPQGKWRAKPNQKSTGDSMSFSNKNKYLKRITEMIESVQRDDPKVLERLGVIDRKKSATLQGSTDAISLQDRLYSEKMRRNRQSAKDTRERRKLYIDLMEAKLATLQRQKKDLQERLTEANMHLAKASSQSQPSTGFTAGRHHTLKKLEQLLLKQQDADIDQINIIIDSMRYRIGATGKQRLTSLNQSFKQITNTSLTVVQRYLIWAASEQRHLFSVQADQDKWFTELMETVQFTTEQTQFIKQFRATIVEKRADLDEMMEDIRLSKEQLSRQGEIIEEEVDSFRTIFTPLQCAIFLLFIEANRYRRELCMWEERSTGELQSELEAGVTKKVKMT